MIVLWGAFWAAILFLLLKVCGALRMPEEVEILGLEYADLGWNGYKLKSGVEFVSGRHRHHSAKPEQNQVMELPTARIENPTKE